MQLACGTEADALSSVVILGGVEHDSKAAAVLHAFSRALSIAVVRII